ncbi:MAG: hypothetical protein EOO99_10475 [Pedobacter sp.]|nr:MAG: hypothetical protein EOO99_10475 [Pedobacter sp.]
MKKLLLFFVFILSSTWLFAQNSGIACKIGHDFIYTEYLGKASAYTGTAPIHYFRSTGNKIPFYWGYGYNQHQGYKCGFINMYPASSYWNGSQNIPIEAEQEFIATNQQCVIAPYLGAPPVATDTYGSYSYNKTGKCGGGNTNVPLDDYIPFLLIGVGFVGFYFLKSRTFI